MGGIAATLRNIEAHVKSSKHLNLKISMSWQSNHHDEPYDSDNFQDHTKKCNQIVDEGASSGRDFVSQDPQPLPAIKQDFGSRADARSSPARPGHGHVVTLAFQHLNASDVTKKDVSEIQSARLIEFLSSGDNAIGTTARHLIANRVDPVLTCSLRDSVPPRLMSATMRYCCGRWKSSNSEFQRHLEGSPVTDIFPAVMKMCRRQGDLCLWCPTDIKDSMFHARFDTDPPCQEPNTLAINNLSHIVLNEALTRTGRTILPQRASFPPPPMVDNK